MSTKNPQKKTLLNRLMSAFRTSSRNRSIQNIKRTQTKMKFKILQKRKNSYRNFVKNRNRKRNRIQSPLSKQVTPMTTSIKIKSDI